jgi:hypothetical protein
MLKTRSEVSKQRGLRAEGEEEERDDGGERQERRMTMLDLTPEKVWDVDPPATHNKERSNWRGEEERRGGWFGTWRRNWSV